MAFVSPLKSRASPVGVSTIGASTMDAISMVNSAYPAPIAAPSAKPPSPYMRLRVHTSTRMSTPSIRMLSFA